MLCTLNGNEADIMERKLAGTQTRRNDEEKEFRSIVGKMMNDNKNVILLF